MWSITAMNFSHNIIHGLRSSKIIPSCSLAFYALSNIHEVFVVASYGSCSHQYRLMGLINCVKFSSCLQRLKQIYLLTYYQTEWAVGTKINLGLLFWRIIHLPLTARTIHTSIQSICITSNRPYAYTFVCTRDILPCRLFGLCSSVRMPLYPDRGLPLFPNSVLHVQPQISTERPSQFIVGLIW